MYNAIIDSTRWICNILARCFLDTLKLKLGMLIRLDNIISDLLRKLCYTSGSFHYLFNVWPTWWQSYYFRILQRKAM